MKTTLWKSLQLLLFTLCAVFGSVAVAQHYPLPPLVVGDCPPADQRCAVAEDQERTGDAREVPDDGTRERTEPTHPAHWLAEGCEEVYEKYTA